VISSRSRKRSKYLALGIAFLVFSCVLPLSAMAVPEFTSIEIPATTQTGQPIHISVNITSNIPIHEVLLTYNNPSAGQLSYDYMNLSEGNESCGVWTFEIPAQSWKGSLECSITAKDNVGNSSQYPAVNNAIIEIQGDDPPTPFPWNWVIIIGFLAVVLVLTELVFKPGVYRPTGREKARALEEEDRKREQEEADKKN
jgi:hypothetical protein